MFKNYRASALPVVICLIGLYPPRVSSAQTAKPLSPTQPNVLPVYIEEFFLSEAVRSEDRGELQFTIDSIKQKNYRSPEDGSSAELDIEYGITDRIQFSLELPYGIETTPYSVLPSHWSTISPSLLYQFIRSNHPFALSAAMGVDLPLNSTGDVGFEPEIMAAKGFGKFQLHASFIPDFDDEGTSLAYNLAALRPIAHHLIPTLEFNGRRESGINSFYLTPGIYKHLPHRLELGAAAPIGLSGHSSPVGAVVKMTWELGGDDDD